MKRLILILSVSAMLVVSALSASAQDFNEESGKLDETGQPSTPECGWHYFEEAPWEPWWEYWCWWPGWGWEFVFWTWA